MTSRGRSFRHHHAAAHTDRGENNDPAGAPIAAAAATTEGLISQPAIREQCRLIHLPPYSPELNAIEKVWQYLRDRYLSGRLFSGTRAIVDACCEAWNKLIAETGRIQSLTDFEWARQVSP